MSSDSSSSLTDDLVEITQLLARYAVAIARGDIEGLLAVFTPDGTYSAFGDTYPLSEFPALVAAAPKGLFLTGTPAITLSASGGAGTGTQPLCFIDHGGREDVDGLTCSSPGIAAGPCRAGAPGAA